MNLEKINNIHFIGIGGIGASSLAQILFHKGKNITGSDSCPSEITKSLKLSGVDVSAEHHPKNISNKCELVVYSPAIPNDNPELIKAKELNIPTLSYPEALGELTKNYYTIAVTGTHGKSTTTAMTALALIEGGLDPTVVVGTKIKEFNNKNYRVGESNLLIIEACEYKESFLSFDPNIVIITNIELDHMDYYKNIDQYKSAYNKFCDLVPEDGYIIINKDDPHSIEVCGRCKSNLIYWGHQGKGYDYYLEDQNLIIKKKVEEDQIEKIHLKPSVPGKFNIENATNAAICAYILDIPIETIEESIKKFKGTWRRMEEKKNIFEKTKVFDDYAHHPTEITRTLEAFRDVYPDEKILCVFQPHQYSRTFELLKQFGESFNLADLVIIPNIYKVRDSEEDIKKVSTDDLVKEIKKHNPDVINGKGLEKTAEYIRKEHHKFDIIITMGAGNIHDIYKLF